MKKEIAKHVMRQAMKTARRMSQPRLNAVKFGLAGGIVSALTVFLITIVAMIGYCATCALMVLGAYGTFGYSINFSGAIIGAVYAFIDGFFFVTIFAWIYNKLL